MNLFDFFSFFSHAHSEIAENGADKVLSSGEKNSSVQKAYVNFPTSRKRALDVPLYAISSGRSMVEMLGVLAIIGVLSVGAISGYSKAMMKYKLNKQAEAANILINYGLQYKDHLPHNKGTTTYYNLIFKKLGLIPDGIRYISNTDMRDIFNNSITIYYNNAQNGSFQNDFGGIRYTFYPSPDGLETCRNITNVAKENAQNLWLVETYKHYTDSEDLTMHGHLYGDNYCGNGNKCLRNLSLNDLDNLCNICDEEQCTLYILWQ